MPVPVTLYRADAVDYDDGLAWQHAAWRAVLDARERGEPAPEALALIQHTPVYTMGARGGRAHLLVDPAALEARGARVVDTDRGGDITFHGPGQLVAYPVLDLHARGLRAADYIRALEQCVIETLRPFDVQGFRRRGFPGVWVAPLQHSGQPGALAGAQRRQIRSAEKITAVGVRVQRGISRHGLALNVTTDLAWFDAIIPCGIPDAPATSMARVLGHAPAFERVVEAFRAAFEHVFGARLHDVSGSSSPSPRDVERGPGGEAQRRLEVRA